MIKITNEFSVECKKCGTENTIDIADFEPPETTSDERNMGYEIEYLWHCEFSCSKCSNDIEVVPRAYEYPMGILNYHDVECTGAIIIDKPNFEIDHQEEE